MKKARNVLKILGVASLLCSAQAHAGSLRCGTALVGEGAQMAEVLDKCGQPPRQDSQGPASRPYGYNGYWNSAKISIWVYGPDGGAYQYLRFVDERLVEIEMRRKAPGRVCFRGSEVQRSCGACCFTLTIVTLSPQPVGMPCLLINQFFRSPLGSSVRSLRSVN